MSSREDNTGFPNKEPEILPPEDIDEEGSTGDSEPRTYTEIIAQINQYTNRPDLFLETAEKYDPGFIKKMNAESRIFSRKFRYSKFKFGQNQSYTALAVSVLAAVACLAGMFYLVEKNQANMGTFIGIAVLYAVTQGGTNGFLRIIEGVRDIIGRSRDKGQGD